ncbi:hypothetical protein [Lentzea flaviverrucosa]|uniref:hypothetical protein n=1 Tax=Lentzea flaviverrucosa TaxID=200379 RepID=UPI000B7FF442|nr:hypothetical protein [Lentzea flaviverrucosa]
MTAPDVTVGVSVADEAEYVALASGDAETVSTDAFGCGCVPVLRGDEAKVPYPRPPGHFLAAQGVPAQDDVPPPHAPPSTRRTASTSPPAGAAQLPLHLPASARRTASTSPPRGLHREVSPSDRSLQLISDIQLTSAAGRSLRS